MVWGVDRPEFISAVARDISEIAAQRTQILAMQDRLVASNRDLQDFAYVASHDLQEPLRKISAFSDRLATRYIADLDDRAVDYLDRIQNASERMQQLIEDLLAFSRINTRAQPAEPTNLEHTIAGVLEDLELACTEARATVHVGALPTIQADPIQMRQLFQNLIGNAIKFRRAGVPPEITIDAEPDADGCWVVTVSDNGIGFDQKYADKVFTVFQRLHGRAAYSGSGVGLSICRRIAERQGGEITVRSAEGEGSTFTIVLPECAPDDGELPPVGFDPAQVSQN